MTPDVIAYVKKHADKLTGRVIDVGSKNHNGNLNEVIKVDTGIDMQPGEGVDVVCKIEEMDLTFKEGEFDSLVSTETLEHCADWKAFVLNTWAVVKDGGYLLITMASTRKSYHGYPDDYWRLTADHVKQIWPDAEDITDLGQVSIGWVVKKRYGRIGDLDTITPIIVESRRHRR